MIERLLTEEEMTAVEHTFPTVWKEGSIARNRAENPASFYWIYKEEGKILGCINYTVFYERMELVDLYVLPVAWNRGIGRQLLEKMLEEAERQAVESITLEVSVENERALGLYRKYGFVEVGKRPRYYDGVDALLLERKMSRK